MSSSLAYLARVVVPCRTPRQQVLGRGRLEGVQSAIECFQGVRVGITGLARPQADSGLAGWALKAWNTASGKIY